MHRLYDKCHHAKECVHGAPQAFDRNKRPWIDVNAASSERIWRAEYSRAAEPPVRFGESQSTGSSEPPGILCRERLFTRVGI